MATWKLLTNLSNFPVPIFKGSSGHWALQNHSACGGGQLHIRTAHGLFTLGKALSMYTNKNPAQVFMKGELT
jgi:hypothetical protein